MVRTKKDHKIMLTPDTSEHRVDALLFQHCRRNNKTEYVIILTDFH